MLILCQQQKEVKSLEGLVSKMVSKVQWYKYQKELEYTRYKKTH